MKYVLQTVVLIQFVCIIVLLGALVWQAKENVSLAREHAELADRISSLEAKVSP